MLTLARLARNTNLSGTSGKVVIYLRSFDTTCKTLFLLFCAHVLKQSLPSPSSLAIGRSITTRPITLHHNHNGREKWCSSSPSPHSPRHRQHPNQHHSHHYISQSYHHQSLPSSSLPLNIGLVSSPYKGHNYIRCTVSENKNYPVLV